ncbi:hypothetical protein C1H46_040950 [Malus baccata]|uniref:Uncharacterized protein n=1 Tax=Malus baccata TaxID=106549 RepID=A0A540KH15_MALBA|nr:hypothetical protein C1H46_040950 [Malus baccata]
MHRDRKYAVQPRNVYAAGVHKSQNLAGKTTRMTRIKYFHYRGTINTPHEPCIQLINATETYVDDIPYVMDTTMISLAGSVKEFELRMTGDRIQKTRHYGKENSSEGLQFLIFLV